MTAAGSSGGAGSGLEAGSAASSGERRRTETAVYVAVSDIRALDRPAGQPVAHDPTAGGGLFALGAADGAVLWRAPPANACGTDPKCSPAQLAAVTATPDFVLSGSIDGHIRAYSAADGRVLWDYDMARPFKTVNDVEARGGSLDTAGPTVAGA